MFRPEDILYEDNHLLVVNKPAGVLTVPGKTEGLVSVSDYVRNKYPEAKGPLIVHRLDMATSGLLLIAKTPEAYFGLQRQFLLRSIRKRYVALLDTGRRTTPLLRSGVIDLPLSPDLENRPCQMVDRLHGKQAVTRYEVVETQGNIARVLFYPLTGRTHQLRVHASHSLGLGCPIVGDELYGQKADGLYLHSEYLAFRHPVLGDLINLQRDADF